jgi:hypothetical protein
MPRQHEARGPRGRRGMRIALGQAAAAMQCRLPSLSMGMDTRIRGVSAPMASVPLTFDGGGSGWGWFRRRFPPILTFPRQGGRDRNPAPGALRASPGADALGRGEPGWNRGDRGQPWRAMRGSVDWLPADMAGASHGHAPGVKYQEIVSYGVWRGIGYSSEAGQNRGLKGGAG